MEEAGCNDIVLSFDFLEATVLELELIAELVNQGLIVANDIQQDYFLFVHILYRALILLFRAFVSGLQIFDARLVLGYLLFVIMVSRILKL